MNKHHDLALSLALAADEAAPFIARADGGRRNAVLLHAARLLRENAAAVLAANRDDVLAARKSGLSAPMLDRLALTRKLVLGMADGAERVAALPDPVGQVLDGSVRPNGLRISRVRTPLGAILIIFEARPNVTVDAACLCLKSGNSCILRGGKEAIASNMKLGEILTAALAEAGLPARAAQVVAQTDRELVPELLGLDRHIDLAVPRGGRGLVETVMRHARMPVMKHLDGVCHTYVDRSADIDMARAIVLNAKTSRPSTCNATETLLVHRDAAGAFLPGCLAELAAAGVELRCDPESLALARAAGVHAAAATEEDWRAEYNALILAVRVVSDLDGAAAHINAHGSRHTEAIVTSDLAAAEYFKLAVDAASVMVNASTRFADGFEYGLGAEIGISTDKLHARGPVGLEGLTTYKWLVEGSGQVRE